MKTICIVITFLLSIAVCAQDYSPNTIRIFGPKFIGDIETSYTTSVKNTVAKMNLYFNNGKYEHSSDYTPLYLNKSTRDFTIIHENAMVLFIAAEQAFYLNKLVINDMDLLPPGSKLASSRESHNNGNILLAWMVGGKELLVILQKEDLKESLDYNQKKNWESKSEEKY